MSEIAQGSEEARRRRDKQITKIVDECMKCGRPWDGRTLPKSFTKAWCPICESVQRFHTNTYVRGPGAVKEEAG